MAFPKHDRFDLFNKTKKPDTLTKYPMALQNDDGTTTIVQDEEEHRKVSGKRFDPDSYVGAKRGEASPPQPLVPQIDIPTTALQRNGAKLRSLDGNTMVDQVPLAVQAPVDDSATAA